MYNFPKVLLASPTTFSKNYCFMDWMNNVMDFKYPNFDVRLFDNTNDKGTNARHLNELISKNTHWKSGLSERFYAQNSLSLNASKESRVFAKMTLSHNDAAKYAIKNGYDYLFHLETDVFPKDNIIETLISHNKSVVGGLYYRAFGKDRSLMVQRKVYNAFNDIQAHNFTPQDDIYFIDGTLKPASSIGLGCILIKTKVLKKIPFRFVDASPCAPDSFFAEDCFSNNIKIYADTSCIARHDNQDWGMYGIEYK